MSLSRVFTGAVGTSFAVAGAAAGWIMDMPVIETGVIALGAGAGAAFTSAVSRSVMGAAFDGKGGGAAFAGLLGLTASHIVLVPAAAVVSARAALNAVGISP